MWASLVALFALYSSSSTGLEIEIANQWIHQTMDPSEIFHHFGTHDVKKVLPSSYRVIRITQNGTQVTLENSFGVVEPHQLALNDQLLPEYARILVTSNATTKEVPHSELNANCHYILASDSITGSLSSCNGESGFTGHFLGDQTVYQVKPLQNGFNNEDLHIMTSKPLKEVNPGMEFDVDNYPPKVQEYPGPISKRANGGGDLIVEIGVFMDSSAHNSYLKYYKDEAKIINLLLTYINGIQSLYYQSSLGRKVNFRIVHLEVMTSDKFQTHNGLMGSLLDSFCSFQAGINPVSDTDPNHWDMSLLVSGLDFVDPGGNPGTMGLAYVGQVCTRNNNCIIGEMGVLNSAGKPYPSTGFASVFVMAHEIGHNLGMHHDGNVGCANDGFIMSASRGTHDEIPWSSCSAKVIQELNLECLTDSSPLADPGWNHAAKFNNYPGLYWSSDEQCQILLKDIEAKTDYSYNIDYDICMQLHCKSPTKVGFFSSGPALEGTSCDLKNPNKICHEAKCVDKAGVPFVDTTSPQWTPWSSFTPCESGCISGSRGIRSRTRSCRTADLSASSNDCQGPSLELQLCDDYPPCASAFSPTGFAESTCQKYQAISKRLQLDLSGGGKQMAHNPANPFEACTVYCERLRNGEFYSPQQYIVDSTATNIYLPDGTWCHNDGKADYYCMKNVCTTPGQAKTLAHPLVDVDLFMNARPKEVEPDPALIKLFMPGAKPASKHPDRLPRSRNMDVFDQFLLDGIK